MVITSKWKKDEQVARERQHARVAQQVEEKVEILGQKWMTKKLHGYSVQIKAGRLLFKAVNNI